MRIISNFKDYYDTAAMYGIDKTIVYERKTIELERKDDYIKKINDFSKIYLDCGFFEDWSRNISFSPFFINNIKSSIFFQACFLIAGKVYFGFVFSPNEGGISSISKNLNISFDKMPKNIKPFFINNEEQFNKFEKFIENKVNENKVNENKIHENKESIYLPLKNYQNILNQISNIKKTGSLKRIIALNENSKKLNVNEIHAIENSPLLMLSNSLHHGNKKDLELRNYGIQSLIDPVTLNQEIGMYISGVLASKENKIIQTSDIDKLISKGFDKNISFRTRKNR